MGGLQAPEAAARGQRVLTFLNHHFPRQPNPGLHVRQAATCLSASVVERIRILHRHTAGSRHGAASKCPVGTEFFEELRQAVQFFNSSIEQRLLTLG